MVLALLPIAVLLPIFLGFTMVRWIGRIDELLIAKVASDLRIAEQYFLKIEADQALSVQAVGESKRFSAALDVGDASLDPLLAREKSRLGLDFLVYHELHGDGHAPLTLSAPLATDQPGTSQSGLVVLPPAELDLLSPGLAAQAEMQIMETPAARDNKRVVEERGMVLWAAYQLPSAEGYLLGGRLLNRNLDIIDTMNDLIYRGGTTEETRTGTTTLFLEDVRISTNVRLFEGERALGTQASEVVWRQVLGEGTPWLDRAFVVNDWYISGYVPLKDMHGNTIGMLYTGFLEAPFSSQRNRIVITLVLSFLAVLALSAPIFLRLARGMFEPLEKMTATMAQVEGGALDARIGALQSKDEIGSVALHLDRLLDQVQERDEALRTYADTLNDLVEKRTYELRESNQKLEATFAQLVLKEKLASIGEITAGVAHEINNPVAVIQGNMELLRDGLPEAERQEFAVELDLIEAQTRRINVIVGKLLNFSKPGQMPGHTAQVSVKEAIETAIVLVAADLRAQKITIEREDHEALLVEIVESELQQVLVNLFINAAQAMEADGVLTVKSGPMRQDDKEGVLIEVRDTGSGISGSVINHVFDPFFTTKQAEGTGLGLSISQALISRAGGIIWVESDLEQGAKFFVWLPASVNLPWDL